MVIDSEVRDLVKKAEEKHGDKAAYYLAATILWLEDYCSYLERSTSSGFIRNGPPADKPANKNN